jgi:hypothetical protein
MLLLFSGMLDQIDSDWEHEDNYTRFKCKHCKKQWMVNIGNHGRDDRNWFRVCGPDYH